MIMHPLFLRFSSGYHDFLENWASFAADAGFASRFLVFAEDMATYQFSRERWPRQTVRFHVPELESIGKGENAAVDILSGSGKRTENLNQWQQASFRINDPGFKNLMYRRVMYIQTLIDGGFDVLITDVDYLWVKNPFPFLEDPSFDVIGVREFPDRENFSAHETYLMSHRPRTHEHAKLCGGFLLFRNSIGGRLILDALSLKIFRAQRVTGLENDQFYLGVVVYELLDLQPAPRIGVLPQQLFPPGWLYFRDSIKPKGYNAAVWHLDNRDAVVTVHNNWLIGKERKLKRFQKNDLWRVKEMVPT